MQSSQSSSALMFMGASAGIITLEASRQTASLAVRSPYISQLGEPEYEFHFPEVNGEYEAPLSPKLLNFDLSASWESAVLSNEQKQKRRLNLRSFMLERRELEQLPPAHQIKRVFNRNINADEANTLRGSPSPTALSSADASSVPASPSCASTLQGRKKKSNRSIWSKLKLDFLHTKKLGASPSKAAALARPHHAPHAATNHAPPVMNDLLSDSTDFHECSHHFNDAHGDLSPARQSTCSSCRSSMSSSDSALGEREKGTESRRKSKCASAPVTPAASPSRAYSPAAAKGTAGHILYANAHWPAAHGVKRPMSPHAQHYQQQRARAEELSRRTLLPYRQSIFGACFFLSTHPQVAC